MKTVEQQTIQALHRVRTQWQTARTARINLVRAFLREQGLPMPLGAHRVLAHVAAIWAVWSHDVDYQSTPRGAVAA